MSTDDNGLYYMRQRYYNTEIKRFVNQDIVVGSINNSQSLNRYCYVQGNPVTLTDPFGLSPSNGDLIMGVIHGVLDVAGCSPELVGICANVLNAALYAFVDHDYAMASLSVLGAVTLGTTKIVAMGGKLAKYAKTVETVGKFISNVASFAICASQAMDVGADMWQKYYVEGKSLGAGSAMEFMALGLNIAGMAVSGKGMVESGNKICKSIKESGVTNRISSKVKSGLNRALNNKSVNVGLDASVGGSGTLGNTGEIRYREGRTVNPMEVTYDMRLNPEEYAYAVAYKYGINLRGSGQQINIKFDPYHTKGPGVSRELDPTNIILGPQALISEEELTRNG